MQKWEYLFVSEHRDGCYVNTGSGAKSISEKTVKFYEYINALGEQGWEMVTAINDENSYWQLAFKRPIE
jgi:hypothetical protein